MMGMWMDEMDGSDELDMTKSSTTVMEEQLRAAALERQRALQERQQSGSGQLGNPSSFDVFHKRFTSDSQSLCASGSAPGASKAEVAEVFEISSQTSLHGRYSPLSFPPIDYEFLLEGKVLPPSDQPERRVHFRLGKTAVVKPAKGLEAKPRSKKHKLSLAEASALITHCSIDRVSRMGGRQLPLHVTVAGEFIHPGPRLMRYSSKVYTKDELLKQYDPVPRCQIYDMWLQSKKLQEKLLLQSLTMKDLKQLVSASPGEMGIALAWNQIADRIAREKAEAEKKSILERTLSEEIRKALQSPSDQLVTADVRKSIFKPYPSDHNASEPKHHVHLPQIHLQNNQQ